MKKIIFILALSIMVTFPTKTQALIVFSPTEFATQIVQKGLQIAGNLSLTSIQVKEYALDTVAYTIAQKVKDTMKQEIIRWAQDGGTGAPSFLDNPERFFSNIATQELTLVKNDLIKSVSGLNVNDPVVRELLAGNSEGAQKKLLQSFMVPTSNRVIQSDICRPERIRAATGGDVAREREYRARYCNGSATGTAANQQNQNLEKCFADSFSCGGWGAFLSFTQDPYRNTEAGRLRVAELALVQEINKTTTEVNNELNRSGGFFSSKECLKAITNDDEGNPLPKESQICLEYETKTPGEQIKSLTNEVLGDPLKQLQQADEISEIIVSALLTKLQSVGLKGLNKAINQAIQDTDSTKPDRGDGSSSLSGSIISAGNPQNTPTSTQITLSNSEHRNLTAPIISLMSGVLREHSTNISVVEDELNKYNALARLISDIEECNASKNSAFGNSQTFVNAVINEQKPIIANKVLSLAEELATYKTKAEELEKAIETIQASRNADAITNIYTAFNTELAGNAFLTSANADKRKLDNEELYKRLEELNKTFSDMLLECQTRDTSPGA